MNWLAPGQPAHGAVQCSAFDNKTDRVGTNFFRLPRQIAERLQGIAVPVQIPVASRPRCVRSDKAAPPSDGVQALCANAAQRLLCDREQSISRGIFQMTAN
jgi:translation elongation factor EF-G